MALTLLEAAKLVSGKPLLSSSVKCNTPDPI